MDDTKSIGVIRDFPGCFEKCLIAFFVFLSTHFSGSEYLIIQHMIFSCLCVSLFQRLVLLPHHHCLSPLGLCPLGLSPLCLSPLETLPRAKSLSSASSWDFSTFLGCLYMIFTTGLFATMEPTIGFPSSPLICLALLLYAISLARYFLILFHLHDAILRQLS